MLLRSQTDVDLTAIESAIDTSKLGTWDYVTACIIVVAGFALSRVAKLLVSKAIARGGADAFVGQLLGRFAGYLVMIVAVVYALDALGIAAGPAIGALGIVGIALAFALQDMLENFIAGVLIQLRRPFTAGQEVVIAEQEGTVVEIDARAVVLDTPDGERVRLPSSEVIKNPIVNHTVLGSRRTDLVVGVAYGTDLQRAATLAAEAVTDVDLVLTHRPVEALVTDFGDSSINLTVRFWHEPSIRGRWHARNEAALAIDRAYRKEGIVIPFPQRVVTMVPTESSGDT